MESIKYKYGSLFSGIDTPGLAAKMEGFETVFGCEIDPYCRVHFKEHNPGAILYGDIREVKQIPYVDVLFAGFPCQDASNACKIKSKNPLNEKRTGLFWNATELIRESKPRVIIFENVAALLNKGVFDVLQFLTENGYDSEWCVLSAKQFGAAMERKRVFIVGYASGKRRETFSGIFNGIIEKNNRQTEWEKRRIQQEQCRTICRNVRRQAFSRFLRESNGHTPTIFDGLRTKAIGGSIYYPIAENIIREVVENMKAGNI